MSLHLHEKTILAIPSRGRPRREGTWEQIPPHMRAKNTFIFVRKDEEKAYRAFRPLANLVVIPPTCVDLGRTFQWIIDWSIKRGAIKLMRVDDDLRMFARTNEGKFIPAGEKDMEQMIATIASELDSYSLVGIPGRFLANHLPRGTTDNKRPACFFGFDLVDFAESGIKYGDIKVQIDIKVGLMLLLKGYSNIQLTEWAHDQKFDQPGGCQLYRTAKVLNDSSIQLAKEFPDYVKIFHKQSSSTFKTASENGIRTEVRVQWAKAAKAGKKNKS